MDCYLQSIQDIRKVIFELQERLTLLENIINNQTNLTVNGNLQVNGNENVNGDLTVGIANQKTANSGNLILNGLVKASSGGILIDPKNRTCAFSTLSADLETPDDNVYVNVDTNCQNYINTTNTQNYTNRINVGSSFSQTIIFENQQFALNLQKVPKTNFWAFVESPIDNSTDVFTNSSSLKATSCVTTTGTTTTCSNGILLDTSYYSPSQIKSAYLQSNSNYTGAGIKIGIIVKGYYSALQSDLDVFCTAFGIPKTTLVFSSNITPIVSSSVSTASSSTIGEQCLDTQWAYSMAPGATIYVGVANSSSKTDIETAISTAISAGCQIISMSFGSSTGFNCYLSAFEKLFQTTGICFVAASGDSGPPASYPNGSANVLSVGGTILSYSSSTTKYRAVSYSSGCGPWSQSNIPSYQSLLNGINAASTLYRNTCDLSLNANNFAYYCSSYCSTSFSYAGGTSFSAPIMAGFLALINQEYYAKYGYYLSTSTLATQGQLQTILYQNIYPTAYTINTAYYGVTASPGGTFGSTAGSTAIFYDVTSGYASGYTGITGCTGNSIYTGLKGYTAATGYDLPTGLGSPFIDNLLTEMLKYP